MENILDIKNLTKSYKAFTLENINLSLPKGYIMGLIGENGAGKTTLIKLIMNLVKKNAGSIDIFGMDNLKYEKEVKDRIGFVYDNCFCYDYLSLEDNAKLMSSLYSKWSFDTFERYINKFSLNKKQKLRELSKGMRMKFALCLALSHGAELIIMDEPTAGLDPIVRTEVLEELQDLIEKEELTIIISTHITKDLEKIADYITFLKDGKIVFSNSKEDIFENYKVIKGNNNTLSKEAEDIFIGVRKNKYSFEGLTTKGEEAIKLLGSDIIIEKASLEDIMLLYNNK